MLAHQAKGNIFWFERKSFISIHSIWFLSYSSDIAEDSSYEPRQKRDYDEEKVLVEPPHLCTKKPGENGTFTIDKCHVYTENLDDLKVHAVLHGATNQENDTHSAEWCNYPLGIPNSR